MSFWRVISHNDRLTGVLNLLALEKNMPGPSFAFKYDDGFACSPVRRWSHAARRSCWPAKCLSSPAIQLRISMQERTLALGRRVGGSEAVMKQDRFLSARRAYVFLCTFSQHGPGEQVVSHRGIWCAPR